MLKDTRIGAVVFLVADLERTRHFYGEVLGLECEWMEGHGARFLTAQLKGSVLVFFQGEERPARTPIVVFAVEPSADIEAMVEQLATQGVEIIAPVQEAPDGGLTADFADPDGYVLSLHQSR